jgi:two-component system chemotaxis response regulator CheY
MGKSILIVDDSPSLRQMVAMTLEEAGYAVMQGADGKDALGKLGSKRVDLIITDLNMPVMDGITFIKQIRTRAESKFTPILMLTTESAAEKKAEGKAAGATAWIVKPFERAKLLQAVDRLFLK